MDDMERGWAMPAGHGGASTAARRLWQVLEPLHAVTYFSEACAERYRELGLKGFWMGYFASRSAPFGEASPDLVTATFFNFRPSMVERALPDAWALASPPAVLAARLDGSLATLRSVLGEVADGAEVTEAAELAEAAVDACPLGGRPLFAALLALDRPEDPLGRLWHAATLLREHRGDGHVVACVANGLSGLDAHLTLVASGAIAQSRLQPARGWTDDEWDAAADGLRLRGWLDADGAITDVGRAGRRATEALTDDLAAEPWLALGSEATTRLHDLAFPLARRIAASGALPFPNPIGVPDPRGAPRR